MNEVCSVACPMTAGNASFAATRDASRSLLRWVVLGAASLVLFVFAAAHSGSVGAATPATSAGTYCISFYTCYNTPGYSAPVYTGPTYTTPVYTAPTYVAPAVVAAPAVTTSASGYAPNTVVSSYYDPRYGPVSVVTDATGNLIDINSATGQRIYPYAPDYGYGYVGGSYFGANYIGSNIAYNGGYNYGYLNNNVYPAGGTAVGGVVYYNDNRFCGDGKVAFVPGRGYYCQNGGPLVTNGSSSVNCGNFFLNGCGIWRGYEADTTAAPAATTQPQVTAFSAPAAKAPVVAPAAVAAPAAPVVAAAAPVVAPAAAVVAPAAPVSAKVAMGTPGIAPVGGVQIDPSSR